MKYTCITLLLVTVPAVFGFGVPSAPDAPLTASSRRGFLASAGAAAVGVASTTFGSVAPAYAYYVPAPHSMDGKLTIITGGTAGLGLETAKRLAAAGGTIVLTSRTSNKGSQAVEEIQNYLKEAGVENKDVYSIVLDLDDLESVNTFSKRFQTSPVGSKKIDVLLNNAGVMAIPDRQLTKDGFERTFQSNHLGHFVLTANLFSSLASNAKIINVASEAYKFAGNGLELDNLNGEKSYGPWSSYGQSKLSNILFTKELQARLDKAGLGIKAYSLHPGAVQTDLARNMMGTEKWEKTKEEGLKGFDFILFNTLAKFIKTVQDGASTQVFLASGQDNPAGKYYVDEKPQSVFDYADDMDAADKLWTVSEKLGKVSFPI